MPRLSYACALSLIFAGAACGGGASQPVDGAAEAPSMCAGMFATLTRAQLAAQTNADGECAGTGNLNVICANDVAATARACGVECRSAMPSANDVTLVVCTNECLARRLTPDLTPGCQACYTQPIACTLHNCFQACMADPAAAACVACQDQHGCLASFFSCSGLPGAPIDAGTSDAGGAPTDAGAIVDGGSTDAAADAPTNG